MLHSMVGRSAEKTGMQSSVLKVFPLSPFSRQTSKNEFTIALQPTIKSSNDILRIMICYPVFPVLSQKHSGRDFAGVVLYARLILLSSRAIYLECEIREYLVIVYRLLKLYSLLILSW